MGITCEALDKEISALKAGKMTWDTVKQLNLLLDLRAKLGDDAVHGERLTDGELRAWLQRMDNADGSTGQHWTEDQTASIAAAIGVTFDHVTAEEFCAAMNMMYSDYYPVAVEFGLNRPEFYAALAKAFLLDKDGPGPERKLMEYYEHIAKRSVQS